MTMQFLVGVGQTILVIIGAFVSLSVLTSFLRFHHLTQAAPAHNETPAFDSQDALTFEVARRLGTVRRSPPPFCVVSLEPASKQADGGSQAWQDAMLRCLPSLLRRTDTVVPHGPDRVGLVIDANPAQGPAILNRVITQLESVQRDIPWVPLRAGLAVFPRDGERAHLLVEQADAAMTDTLALPDLPAEEPPPAHTDSDQQGLVDELTGLLRPERVSAAVPKYLARYRREGRPLAFLYLDVDRLERVNRLHGREAGDAVLRGLGRVLQRHVREEDLLCRFQGEEFLILASCSSEEALGVAQRLAAHIRRFPLVPDREDLRVTVSIGVAAYPEHGASPRDLFEAAEVALKTAQARGRNMCVKYEPSLRSTRPAARPIRSTY